MPENKLNLLEKLIQKRESNTIIQQKTDEIARLSAQLADQTTETLNNILSKDSYCYIRIVIPDEIDPPGFIHGKAKAYLFHSGKYAIKNIRISLVNTDEEVVDETHSKIDYSEDPKKYHMVDYPYVINIPSLAPNQKIPLPDIDFFYRKQKSYNIFFSADNGFWFQKTLLRSAKAYGAAKTERVDYFTAFTQVDFQNLDPKLNPVHRWEIVKKEGAYGSGLGYRPRLIQFDNGEKSEFAMSKLEESNRARKWLYLHWNGVTLEDYQINVTHKELDGIPLRYY